MKTKILSSLLLPCLVCLACLACRPRGNEGQAETGASSIAELQRHDPPAAPGAMAPALSVGEGGVYLTWLEPEAPDRRDAYSLRLARFEGDRWSTPTTIREGDDFFANWADLPRVTEDGDGDLVAHWLGMLGEDTYAYGVHLARSNDGESWNEVGLLHDDASPTEHGFVSWVPSPEGLYAFWLDGRGMAGGGPMTLRATRLERDGPRPSQTLDDRVCECCSTDAAWTSQGPVVVYRDRDEDEVRNIGVVRAVGEGWSEPTVLHDDGWQIHGCPVNGPAIDAAGDRVAVAWFTVDAGKSRVRLAFSSDAGATFGEPIRIDGGQPLGRVDVALDESGSAYVLWLGTEGEAGEIRLRKVSPDGEMGQPRLIARTTQSRSSGVPSLVRDGERLLVAWVEDGEPSRLRFVSVDLGQLS